MASLLEEFRPRLSTRARIRRRSDGTAAVHDPERGAAAEVAADQTALLALVDGRRTLSDIAEAHYEAHRFVPFTAMRDLLRTLSLRGLLRNDEGELQRAGLREKVPISHREPRTFGTVPLPGAGALSVILAVAWLGAALWLARAGEVAPLNAWDVLWAWAGASFALTGRELLRAAVASVFRAPPERIAVRWRLGVLFVAPDGAGITLLDRGARAFAHLAALLGSAAVLSAATLSRGVAFGALVVLLIDLCPFAPTSAGRLLATLAGRVDLREHARAYLARRFLKRVTSSATFDGEGSLILSALLSLAWLGLITRLLLTWGVVWVVELLAIGVDATGIEQVLAFAGAAVLVLLMPAFLVALIAALWRAVRSLLPGADVPKAHQARAAERMELAAIPLFSRLGADEQAQLAAASEHRTYATGTAIVQQGARGDCFFAIREGEVAVELEEPSGLRRVIAHLLPGDCFGETALLEQETRTATVRALRPTSVVALSREGFDRVRQGLAADDVTALLRATAALRKSAFFQRLSPDRLSALALRLVPRRVKAGEVIVRHGEAGRDFFLVGEGEFEVVDAGGDRLSTLGPGEHFGEVALLRDIPRTATVRAVGDGLLLSLDKDTFLDAMSADLSLSAQLESLAASRVEAAA